MCASWLKIVLSNSIAEFGFGHYLALVKPGATAEAVRENGFEDEFEFESESQILRSSRGLTGGD
jgi:hypothetical protein